MGQQESTEKRRDQRQAVQFPGQFNIDGDTYETPSLDLSEQGIRIRIDTPIKISIRMQIGAYEMENSANLVWARRNSQGQMEYGLEYETPPKMETSAYATPEPNFMEFGGPLRLLW